MDTFECFLFYETNEKFYIDPCTSDRSPVQNNNLCLIIDRFSGEISVSARSLLPYSITDKLIYGIFGVIASITTKYLVIVTKRKLIATINGHCIYAVESTEILPCIPLNQLTKPVDEIRENQIYYQLLQTFVDQKHFYFSNTYDITHPLQNLLNTDADFRRMSLFQRADPRFIWNRFMMKDFAQIEMIDKFIFPIICGFVGTIFSQQQIDDKTFRLTLISRRSVHRAGVRFFSRGLDLEGNVSNFVEIEQIVEHENLLTSLVQIRGSIPLFWSQKPNLERLPWPKIRTDQDHVTAFGRHIKNQLQLYNNQLCILSLISKHGREKQLALAFQHLCSNAPGQLSEQIKFVEFDFHKECKQLDWSKLDQLVFDLTVDIENYGFFCYNSANLIDEPEICRQTGTFRTNCIDCLDRTNVVQSLIARKSLSYQLKKLNILSPTDEIIHYKSFISKFNELWADNGDYLSVQYAGTGALKADFTRTGKRTKLGLINDGVNTGKRYFINNFVDGFRQDALDFCLGNFIGEDESGQKFISAQQSVDIYQSKLAKQLNEWEWRHYVGILLVFVSSMFILSLLLSTDSTFCVGWGLICMLVLSYVYYAGEQIVCKPKLKIE